jgi:hypothetical protein
MLAASFYRKGKVHMKRITMAAIALGLACASASWAQGLQPSKDACAYSVPELETALGIKLQAGRGSEVGFSGGKQLSCSYSGKGLHSVTLTQVRMDNAASLAANFDRFKAGTMEPIAGDADKARWQLGQGDLTDVTLDYLRANTQTQVRVSGVNMKNAAEVTQMRARVQKLRRLP